MSALATSIVTALMLAASLTLLAAVVGVLFMPRPERRGDAFLDHHPWAATRCGTENLRNCASRELPSGETRPTAGRMYASRPAAIDQPPRRLLPRFFRRAL